MKTKALYIMLAAGVLFSSCTKKKDNKDVNYQTLASDSNTTQEMSNDMSDNVSNETKTGQYSGTIYKKDGQTTYQSQFSCATVTISGYTFPLTLTLDFGAGCTSSYDGRTRKGKLTAVFTGPYVNSGTQITITPDNYYVNGYKLEGTKIITNNGRVNGNLSFTDQDINGRITKPDGGVITWESTRTNTWVSGETTTGILGILDDVYSITGYATGVTSDGTDYRIDITTPLEKSIACPYVDQGVLSYTVNGSQIATLDYGTGDCDAQASVDFLGNVYNIVIQ